MRRIDLGILEIGRVFLRFFIPMRSLKSAGWAPSVMTIPDSGFMMADGASCLPIPPEEEKRIVEELTQQSERNLKEGNLYYVISNR